MVDQSALGLETLDENTLKAPKTVIKNPSSGRKVFNELQQRNRNRVWLLSKHQELLDGAEFDASLSVEFQLSFLVSNLDTESISKPTASLLKSVGEELSHKDSGWALLA